MPIRRPTVAVTRRAAAPSASTRGGRPDAASPAEWAPRTPSTPRAKAKRDTAAAWTGLAAVSSACQFVARVGGAGIPPGQCLGDLLSEQLIEAAGL